MIAIQCGTHQMLNASYIQCSTVTYLFSQYNKCGRILKDWKLAPSKKMDCYIYLVPQFIKCQYAYYSQLWTQWNKSVYLSSTHEREYTYGRQDLASRFEIDLVFPGWLQISRLTWFCCFSYLNSEHMLAHIAC